jgi:hypothetical protein
MARIWSDQERLDQSKLTTERSPWVQSTGPKGRGKRKVRKNSTKHGYFSESHRDFRKSKRSPEARNIEGLIRKAGKTKDKQQFFPLVDEIRQKLDSFCNDLDLSGLSPQKVLEGTYLNSLMLSTINNCLYSHVLETVSELREYSSRRKNTA